MFTPVTVPASARGPRIVTSRLVLRRWRESDRAPFAALNADPQVMRFFPSVGDARQSDELVHRIEAGFVERGYGLWALERRDTGTFIGFTGLAPMPEAVPGSGGVEIGWRLARAHWRQGFASEAAEAALAYAFGKASVAGCGAAGTAGCGVVEVNSITAAVNEPSRAVMRRLGMRHVDDFAHPAMPEESPLRPHVRYLLTREEWLARRA